ncbi:hypothetical protein ONE63_010406 [Megalurothrips usitatus]|uniref:Methyl farnesoate epoxidase n=1 Tax=Megalurothrips usitatus TaxID=439358 RepID=A0AAV7XGH0_9NEOP|nr:hypothetical protein ONE63_010406 [Megalurothrips usitatus]
MIGAVFLALLLVAAALALLAHLRREAALKNFPPGPRRWPVLGSLPSMPGTLVHQHAHRHWLPRYGTVVGLTLPGGQDMVMVCGGEEVIAILNHEHCQLRPDVFLARERAFGKRLGISLADGPHWTEQRRFTLRELRDLGLGKSKLEGVILDEANATIRAMVADGPKLEPNFLFNAPVLNVLWWMVSGKEFARGAGSTLDERSRKLLVVLNQAMRHKKIVTAACDNFPILKYVAPEWSSYNEIYKPIFKIQDYLREEIQEQRLKGVGDSYMLKYTEEINKGRPGGFTDENLIINCLDMFTAGGESTANTLSFCLMYMGLYPEVQARVHAELDAAIGGADKTVTMSDKPNLPFLEATLLEVIRSNTISPLAIPHMNSQDIQLNGYTIPKGATLMLSMWSVLNDKKHWGDPEVFRPDRFLDKEGKFTKDPWLIPFGIGKRNCIGEAFALQVAFIFFSNLMNRFTFTLPPGSERPSTVNVQAGLTVTPPEYSIIATPRVS